MGRDRGEHQDQQETKVHGLKELRNALGISMDDLNQVYQSYRDEIQGGRMTLKDWMRKWWMEEENGVNLMEYLIVFCMEIIDADVKGIIKFVEQEEKRRVH